MYETPYPYQSPDTALNALKSAANKGAMKAAQLDGAAPQPRSGVTEIQVRTLDAMMQQSSLLERMESCLFGPRPENGSGQTDALPQGVLEIAEQIEKCNIDVTRRLVTLARGMGAI